MSELSKMQACLKKFLLLMGVVMSAGIRLRFIGYALGNVTPSCPWYFPLRSL
jgi:hypothetical protein